MTTASHSLHVSVKHASALLGCSRCNLVQDSVLVARSASKSLDLWLPFHEVSEQLQHQLNAKKCSLLLQS
jgi:hypothetical protein